MLKGLSDLVEVRKRVTWDWVYVGILLLLVPAVATEWWIIFRWRHFQHWNYYHFVFLLIKPSVLYFIATLLVPRITDQGSIELWPHMQSVRRTVSILFALFFLLDLPDTLLKGWDYFMSQMPEAVVVPAVNVATAVIAAFTRSRRVLAIWVVLVWLYALAVPLLSPQLSNLN